MSSNEKYKFGRREVLTETILSLLADLPDHKKEMILEDDTPEEVVDFCKRIYDSEFDNNVGTLGISGADEIAWKEALGIFEPDEDMAPEEMDDYIENTRGYHDYDLPNTGPTIID